MLGAVDFRYDVIPIDSGVGLAGAGGLLCVWERWRSAEYGAGVRQVWVLAQIAISALLLLALVLALPREKLLEAIERVRWQTLAAAIPCLWRSMALAP